MIRWGGCLEDQAAVDLASVDDAAEINICEDMGMDGRKRWLRVAETQLTMNQICFCVGRLMFGKRNVARRQHKGQRHDPENCKQSHFFIVLRLGFFFFAEMLPVRQTSRLKEELIPRHLEPGPGICLY